MAEREPGGAQTLMVELLYEAPPHVDAEQIAARVRETLAGTHAVGDAAGKAMLAHRDFPREFEEGRKAILTLVVPPEQEKDGVDPERYDLSQSAAFPDAGAAVASARTTRLVAEMLGVGAPVRQRVSAFKTSLEAVIAETEPLAVWSPGAGELLDPSALGQHPLAGLVNVRHFQVEEDARASVMDTLGLHALGMPDFQLHFRDLDPSAVAAHLLNLAAYASDAEEPIESGDTVSGPGHDERWRVQLEKALVGPERLVLDIDPGPPHAAGGRG
jgi:hypothetical protein